MLRISLIAIILVSFLSSNVRAQGCATPSSSEGVNIFGFVQAQYDHNFYDKPESTFGFNRTRIGAMGNIPYDFSYYVLLEASPFKKGAPNAYLLDAFITYKRFEMAKISMGSFKSPFGLELGTACNSLHTINRSRAIEELTTPDRDMGLMISGGSDTTLFKYSIAYLNGTGLLVKDIDTYKDVVGRLVVQPVKWANIGVSYKMGKSENADPNLGEDKRTRFGADFDLKYSNLILQGEYIYGKDEGSYLVGGGCGSVPEVVIGNIERRGMFLMAVYNTPWSFQPVLKYESYNRDLSKTNNNEYITTFGLNYFFNEWTRLQVNYEYAAEKSAEIKNDRLMLQLQVKF